MNLPHNDDVTIALTTRQLEEHTFEVAFRFNEHDVDAHAKVLFQTKERVMMLTGCPDCLGRLFNLLLTDEEVHAAFALRDWPLPNLLEMALFAHTFELEQAVGEGYWRAPRVVALVPYTNDETREAVWENIERLRALISSMASPRPTWVVLQGMLLDGGAIKKPIVQLYSLGGDPLPERVWTPPAHVELQDHAVN
jgi:hypothetical protein